MGSFNIMGQKTVCCGGYSMYCKICSSIPGLYPLDAGSNPYSETQL